MAGVLRRREECREGRAWFGGPAEAGVAGLAARVVSDRRIDWRSRLQAPGVRVDIAARGRAARARGRAPYRRYAQRRAQDAFLARAMPRLRGERITRLRRAGRYRKPTANRSKSFR